MNIHRNLDTTGWFRGEFEFHFEIDWYSIRNRFKSQHRKEMERWNERCARWAAAIDEWDAWQALERRAAAGEQLKFTEYLDIEMYRATAEIKRDHRRQMFGDGNKPKMGLAAFARAIELERPHMIRSMREELMRPSVLWRAVSGEAADEFTQEYEHEMHERLWLHPHLSDDEHGGEG